MKKDDRISIHQAMKKLIEHKKNGGRVDIVDCDIHMRTVMIEAEDFRVDVSFNQFFRFMRFMLDEHSELFANETRFFMRDDDI